jgi:hypothetical protein
MLIVSFQFLLCFGCSFVIVGDTYVAYWFSGCCLFAGSLVGQLLVVFVWLKFTLWALGLKLGLFMLYRWFSACCFLLFDLSLQGWGPALVVGAGFFLDYYCFLGALRCSAPAPMSRNEVVLFSLSSEVDIYSFVRF